MRDVEKDLMGLGYEVEEAAGRHSAAHSLLDVRRAEARDLAVKVSLSDLLARALSLALSLPPHTPPPPLSLFLRHSDVLSATKALLRRYQGAIKALLRRVELRRANSLSRRC